MADVAKLEVSTDCECGGSLCNDFIQRMLVTAKYLGFFCCNGLEKTGDCHRLITTDQVIQETY